MRRTHSMLVLPALLAYLLVSQPGAQGMVLCVGEDGHVAVERALAKPCCPQGPTDGRAATLDADCGACVDIPLPSALDPRHSPMPPQAKVRAEQPHAVAAAVLPSLTMPPAPPATTASRAASMPSTPDHLASLQSTVLLI